MNAKTIQKDLPAPQSVSLKPGLYLVATPIGNMRDISFRALDILSSVDVVACEDTRVTGKLLSAYRIKKPMITYNDHASSRQRISLMDTILSGKSVALVSDAGTPLISDPGYKLVQSVHQAGAMVSAIPGANAALSALQLSGIPSHSFSFLGFLPPKSVGRKTKLEPWRETDSTLIFYETAPRLLESLKDMKSVLGDRPAAVVREITKLFEEVKRDKLSALIAHYDRAGSPKGEICIIVGAPEPEEQEVGTSIESQLKLALKTMSVRDAAEVVSIATGKPKKAIYMLALKLSGK
ncbi:MAG: 16S rRNA (cytidine(1402)-2'-O)-methyltransferase [Alphaproteobacteria bacterium]|nr:16S rRNA (cytidine(1402)-2'-O)-methyltransferase [Alphaproteobacteria bacterium]